MQKRWNFAGMIKETGILTAAVAIIAAAVYFPGAEPCVGQQYFRPWHRSI